VLTGAHECLHGRAPHRQARVAAGTSAARGRLHRLDLSPGHRATIMITEHLRRDGT
jgi:hypothetical protein